MGIENEKKWVIAGFITLAGSILTIFILNAYRESQRYTATGESVGLDAGEIASLKDLAAAIKDPEKRDEALASLPKDGGAAAVDLLAALALKNRDPEVRAAAVGALGDLGDEGGLHMMTICSRDEDARVRIAAVEALGKMTNDTAYGATAEVVANDIDAWVRKRAAEVLAVGKGSSVTLDHLCRKVRNEEDTEVRAVIASALGKLSDKKARDSLIRVLDARNERAATVRLSALKALDAIDDDHRVKGVTCAIGDADEDVRAEAKRVFGELGVEALPALVKALRSRELVGVIKGRGGEAVHRDMFSVVEAMKSPETAETLVRLLDLAIASGTETTRAAIRDDAIRTLSELGEPAVAPMAATALHSGTRWPVKLAASKVFTAVGKASVAPLEKYALSRIALPSSEEAKLWGDTLRAIGGPEAEKALEQVKSHDPDVVFAKLAAAAAARSAGTRPPAPQLEEYNLILYDGIYGGNPPSAYTMRKNNLPFVGGRDQSPKPVRAWRPYGRRNVVFELARTANGWERALGHNLSHNNGVTFGLVTEAKITDEAMDAKMKIAVGRDPWLVGGYGEYTVSLKSVGDGKYRGNYKGRYFDLPIEGVAVGMKLPKRRPLKAGWTPIEPGEHPRLLFRKSDLPRLRAKLNTPLGKAAFRQLLNAARRGRTYGLSIRHAALGLLYQLTGDERYAIEAIAVTKEQMAEKGFGFNALGQIWGPRWSNTALAYDMCYDVWPEAFKQEVRTYLYKGSFAASTKMCQFSVCANSHPCSNYFSPIVGGGSFMALNYWLDPGSPPMPPGGGELIVAEKLTGRPPKGVPVVPLIPNQSPGQWLWSGPALACSLADALVEAIGDTKETPIKEGRTFMFGDDELTFRTIEPRYMRGGMLYPWNAFEDEYPDAFGAGMLMHTIVQNHRPGFYQVSLPAQGSYLFQINGKPVPPGAYVQFEEGLYSLTLSYVGQRDMVSGIGVAFRYVTSEREEIDILLAAAKQKLKRERVLYDLAFAEYERTKMAGSMINTFHMTRTHMWRSHRMLMGDGGFQAEGEGYTHTSDTPLRYAAAYYNIFGQTVTPHPDVTHFPTRYVATSVLSPGDPRRGRFPSLVSHGFNGGGGGTHGVTFISIGFQIIPEEHQPAVLWVWNKIKGVEEGKPETLANLVRGEGVQNVIHTLVNYPLHMKPVHPSERITKTWKAPTKGLYVFRNAWKDHRDIVLLAYANELVTHGNSGPDVGGLRLRGFGKSWTHGCGGKKSPPWLNNIPLLVDNGQLVKTGGPGRVTSWQGEEDGSGHVSINMDCVYSPRRGAGHDRGGIWPADPMPPGPITGLRAIAADYSGKCGAPALFAVVDKIKGGPEAHWVWHLPGKARDMRIDTGKNTFTIHQGRATLHGAFVAPGNVEVRAPGSVVFEMPEDKRGKKPKAVEPPSFGIVASAPAGQSFFLVMTMQMGARPVVKVKGEGLKAVACIGKRQVRFDGEKPVVEDL